MHLRFHFGLFALLLSLGVCAATPSPVSNGEFTPLPNACKSEETIGIIRQHQRNAAAWPIDCARKSATAGCMSTR